MSCSPARSATHTVARRSAASFSNADGGKTWRGRVRRRTPDASDIADDRQPAHSLRRCALENSHVGRREAAAGVFSRSTAASTGRGLRHGLTKARRKNSRAGARSNPAGLCVDENGDGLPVQTAPATQRDRCGAAGRRRKLGARQLDRRDARTHALLQRFALCSRNRERRYFLSGVPKKRSTEEKTSIALSRPPRAIGDTTTCAIDPTNGDRFIVAHDDCAERSGNRGQRAGHQFQLPVAQMITSRPKQSDSGNVTGPTARTGHRPGTEQQPARQAADEETRQGGFERQVASVARAARGRAIPIRRQQHRLGERNGLRAASVERFESSTRDAHAREVAIWPVSTIGTAAADVKYRFNGSRRDFRRTTQPILRRSRRHVHRTTTAGPTLQVIQPMDAQRPHPSQRAGGCRRTTSAGSTPASSSRARVAQGKKQ